MTTPPAGVVLTDDYRQQLKAWIDRNPLRAWRLAQEPRLPVLDAAQMVGVGMSMVPMYEKGAHKPGPKHAERLAELLGPDWSDRWDAWLASRPGV